MNLPRNSVLAITVLCGTFASTAYSRPVKIWTKAELMDKADLVVIATPIGSKTGGGGPSVDNGWRVAIETTFRVQAILKGEPATVPEKTKVGPLPESEIGSKLILIAVDHDAHAAGHEVENNGPTYVRFDGEPRDYLLFLKKTKHGHYEPLSGSYDPAFSVFVVAGYSDPPPANAAEPAPKK